MTSKPRPNNGPSTTGKPSGTGRGNLPPKKKITFLVASFSLALALIFSCSSGGGDEGGDSGGVSSSSIVGANIFCQTTNACVAVSAEACLDLGGTNVNSCTASSSSFNAENSSSSIVSSSSSEIIPGATRQQAISLTNGQNAQGSLTASTNEIWYKFEATAGTSYYLLLNNNSWLNVEAYKGNETIPFWYSSYYSDDEEIKLTSNSTVYLKISSVFGGAASFGITYTTENPIEVIGSCSVSNYCIEFLSSIWNVIDALDECPYERGTWSAGSTCPTGYLYSYREFGMIYYTYPIQLPNNAVTLTENQWMSGNITAGSEAWYKFEATAGTNYYVWWDDAYSGPETYELDIEVFAYDSDGEMLFSEDDVYKDRPETITLSSDGTVYLRVRSLKYESGTFGIVYNTSKVMP